MNNIELVGVVGGGVIQGHVLFEQIISKKNLFGAWREFSKGKKNKKDVRQFAFDLEENLIDLYTDLRAGSYVHGGYTDFIVCDPKRRHIHKASVRDRIVHHAIHRVLYPIWDRAFIFESFSSRLGKGTHAAIAHFERLAWGQSANNTKTVWVLKCDVRKFFDSVDQSILLEVFSGKFDDEKLLFLLKTVIRSFHKNPGKGLPLGNLTSQLLANVYLDGMDHFIKRVLGVKGYVRYADDLLFISRDKSKMEKITRVVEDFLKNKLILDLHPGKTILRKWMSGIDVLGYTSFPHHRLLRAKTERRMLARINPLNWASYASLLKHCRGHGIAKLLP